MDNNQWNGQQPYGQDPNMQAYGQQAANPNMQPYGQQAADPNMQPYGQPMQQPYGQDPNMMNYGQPMQQPYGQPAPAKSKKGLIIGIIAGVVVIAAIIVLFIVLKGGSGKAEKRECEMCYETKMCKEYEVTAFGESEDGWFCDDCYKVMKEYIKTLGGKIKLAD